MLEQEKAFDDAREMFMSQGWKDLIETLQANHDAITIESLQNEKEFWIAKGQLSVLNMVLGYESLTLWAEEEEVRNNEEDI